ncbi:MAG: site-specific integrase [Muribaculaceae bacterium]|nr:site-specific integrase [Muribaculaceae bacterium]
MQTINLELVFSDLVQIEQLLEVKVNGCPISVTGVYDAPSNSTKMMLKPFMQDVIGELLKTGQTRTSETYQSALNSFMLWRDDVDVALSEIDAEMMKSYERYMRERGLSMNTTSFYMRILRAVYNRAVHLGATVNMYPFSGVYTGIPATSKRCVEMETIQAIKDYSCGSTMRMLARDLFMFSFYTHGMSFIDMAFLPKDAVRNGWLRYYRRKTGQSIIVHWESCMQDIVDRHPTGTRYLLPIIKNPEGDERQQYRTWQNIVNQQLKKIADELNLNCNLTMYVARHSWANIAQAMGTPIDVISHGMGHTNERTTRIYLKSLSQNKVDDINRQIISSLAL